MATATIKKQWQVANNGGWAEGFNFFLGSTATPDTAVGTCTAEFRMGRPGRPETEALVYSSVDSTVPPTVVVSGNTVAVTIPRTMTIDWAPGIYDVQLRVIPATGGVDRYDLIGPGRLIVLEAPGT